MFFGRLTPLFWGGFRLPNFSEVTSNFGGSLFFTLGGFRLRILDLRRIVHWLDVNYLTIQSTFIISTITIFYNMISDSYRYIYYETVN